MAARPSRRLQRTPAAPFTVRVSICAEYPPANAARQAGISTEWCSTDAVSRVAAASGRTATRPGECECRNDGPDHEMRTVGFTCRRRPEGAHRPVRREDAGDELKRARNEVRHDRQEIHRVHHLHDGESCHLVRRSDREHERQDWRREAGDDGDRQQRRSARGVSPVRG